LRNAEGASFGSLMKDEPTQGLPPKNSGPVLEDRMIPNLDPISPQVLAVVKEANVLSALGLGWARLAGLFGT
jgi:hypothetical protein